MERKRRGERRRERDEEGMIDRYIFGELLGERRRETEKEREREIRGSEIDVPKLYTYNEYELSMQQKYQGILMEEILIIC